MRPVSVDAQHPCTTPAEKNEKRPAKGPAPAGAGLFVGLLVGSAFAVDDDVAACEAGGAGLQRSRRGPREEVRMGGPTRLSLPFAQDVSRPLRLECRSARRLVESVPSWRGRVCALADASGQLRQHRRWCRRRQCPGSRRCRRVPEPLALSAGDAVANEEPFTLWMLAGFGRCPNGAVRSSG